MYGSAYNRQRDGAYRSKEFSANVKHIVQASREFLLVGVCEIHMIMHSLLTQLAQKFSACPLKAVDTIGNYSK